MSLIESAKLNGHDAWAYLKDVLTKLPTWPNSRLAELLPHRWVAPTSTCALTHGQYGFDACLPKTFRPVLSIKMCAGPAASVYHLEINSKFMAHRLTVL